MGGSALKVNVATFIVICIWIYNVAFNIPMFVWANVHYNSRTGGSNCYPRATHPVYILAARIINFYVPLIITWTSNIGIIYRLKRTMNKAIA